MRVFGKHLETPAHPLAASFLCGLAAVLLIPSQAAATDAHATAARVVAAHAICSGANSAKVPCRFSTPSGNIRCVWTPKPNNVACVMLANGRAYRLGPNGKAKAISLKLSQPGKTLPLNQQLVFPESLSCRDTKRTMVCNQDFGGGAFTLAPGASHRS
ncbi:MAG: hypothetical protein ACHQHO_08005 [Solirubrobacterales bacterium]